MRAVIVEIKNSFAAVLSDDGCISKIKNNNYEIGQVIQMSNPKIHFTKKITALAATAAALVVLSVGTWAYASPYSYVSLDVNPSIEFTVNRFDRVLSVKAINDDGEEVLHEIKLNNLKNSTISKALTKTVKQISDLGYFDGNIEGGIIIATSGNDLEKAEELAQELQQTVENEVALNEVNVEVEAFSVGLERVEQARILGVTPGKLNLVEKLQASTSDPNTILFDEWLDKSVKDIMKATKDNRKTSIVSGSAISLEVNEDTRADKVKENENDAEEKATGKVKNAEEKANEKAKDAVDKSNEKAAKAQEKANETAIRNAEKVSAAEEKAIKKAKADEEKATEKAKKEEERAAEKAKEAKGNEIEKTKNESGNNAPKKKN